MSYHSILPTPENAGILVDLSALQNMDHSEPHLGGGGILDGLLAAQPDPILPVDPPPAQPASPAPLLEEEASATAANEEMGRSPFAWLVDFPEPLSYEQRERVRFATAAKVSRYKVFHGKKEIVQQGYDSLMTLINRWTAEKEELEAKEREASSGGGAAAAAAAIAPGAKRSREEEAPPKREEEATGAPPQPSAPARPRSRLLGSKMFANMQSLLATATAEQQSQSQLIQQRERINRQNKLRVLEADLAEQEPTRTLLRDRLTASAQTDDGLRKECVEALHVWEEMLEMERIYASSFFLHARGATRPVLSLLSHRELLRAAEREEASPEETRVTPVPACTYLLKDYSVYFLPATMTPEIEDRVRCTLESGILDKYVSYRQRIDPLLAKLEEEEKQRQQQRLDALKAMVGIALLDGGDGAGREGILPSLEDLQQAVAGGTAATVTAVGAGGKKKSVMGISDSDSEGEEVAAPRKETKSAEEEEKQRIQSALSALDDFEGF